MRVKVLSSELGRMMRILSGCIDQRNGEKNSNIEICYEENMFSIRAVNNGQFVKMSTPLLGGDGETICVDGKMFANIIGRSSGDVEIVTDEKNCFVKSNGRTRIPLVDVNLAKTTEVTGHTVKIKASDFVETANKVRYATSQEETRPILTGVRFRVENGQLTMTALDGFQLAVEYAMCEGDDMDIVIPNLLIKRICDCAGPEETITIVTDNAHVSLSTDTSVVVGSILHGDFIDVERMIPTSFATEVLINVAELKDALKGSGVVGNVKNLVKFIFGEYNMKVTSNSDRAEFEAEVICKTNGNELTIAFNDKYVMNALSAIGSDEAVIHLNSPVSPAIFTDKGVENIKSGIHLVLPVRVM